MSTWVRPAISEDEGVRLEAVNALDEFGPHALEGVYVSTTGTSYKVMWRAIETNQRGEAYRVQRTKNFPRGATYDRIPYGGRWINKPSALEAACSFKHAMDALTAAGKIREPAREEVTMDLLFSAYKSANVLKPKTVEGYESLYRKHIKPTIGTALVRGLTVDKVERWYAALDATPAARRAALRLVKALLGYAARRGMIVMDPSRALRVRADETKPVDRSEIPTDEDIERLCREVGPRYRALIMTLAYGGLRIGEAAGLRVDRVDFAAGRVVVDQNLVEVGGRVTFGSPKTGAGTRSFTAPPFLISALIRHVAKFPTTTGLVFSAPEGGPLRPGNFRSQVFDRAKKRAGLENLTLHALRHRAASDLGAAGASAVEIAARLGHSNPTITQRIYMHVLEARDHELADRQQDRYESSNRS